MSMMIGADALQMMSQWSSLRIHFSNSRWNVSFTPRKHSQRIPLLMTLSLKVPWGSEGKLMAKGLKGSCPSLFWEVAVWHGGAMLKKCLRLWENSGRGFYGRKEERPQEAFGKFTSNVFIIPSLFYVLAEQISVCSPPYLF